MTQIFNRKTAIAAAVLITAAGALFAQSTPPNANVPPPDTSSNPLQVNPPAGTPNSAAGAQTPGTGTGSSRTMRNDGTTPESNMGNTGKPTSTDMMNEQMRNPNRATTTPDRNTGAGSSGSPSPMNGEMKNDQMRNGTSGSGSTMNRGAATGGSGSMDNGSMNSMEPTGAGTTGRAARSDRG